MTSATRKGIMNPQHSNIDLSSSQPTQQNEDDVDIFSSSLSAIFSEPPVSFSDPTHSFTKRGVTVFPPSTNAENWNLQTDAIWRSALYLADHLPDIKGKDLLELGAGSGLPGILAAKEGSPRSVTLSDYPDPIVLATLQENVLRNIPISGQGEQTPKVNVVGHAWCTETKWPLDAEHFDLIMGADILWMSDQHKNLCATLRKSLRREKNSRIHLVAGLHSTRWTIQRFLDEAAQADFVVTSSVEISSGDELVRRPWSVERADDEMDRKKWLVEVVLAWRNI